MQFNNIFKMLVSLNYRVDRIEREIDKLKTESHPPIFTKRQYKDIDERLQIMEGFFENLEKIANALEKNSKKDIVKKDIPLTIKNDIPGFEGTLDKLDDLCNVSTDDDNTHNDYLNDLVQNMTEDQYLDFHKVNDLSFSFQDAVTMTNYIYSLEYEECLGAIKTALEAIEDNPCGGLGYADDPNLEVQLNQDEPTSDNPDPDSYGNKEYETDLQGIRVDDDHDIRLTAHTYEAAIDENLHTKKDCILDYVTNEFGILGARYTDIIKFAYYLGSPNAPKYTSANRGYYACAFNTNGFGGHLVQGGKDQLVKGINNAGDERYFALSFVESGTEYYKRLDV